MFPPATKAEQTPLNFYRNLVVLVSVPEQTPFCDGGDGGGHLSPLPWAGRLARATRAKAYTWSPSPGAPARVLGSSWLRTLTWKKDRGYWAEGTQGLRHWCAPHSNLWAPGQPGSRPTRQGTLCPPLQLTNSGAWKPPSSGTASKVVSRTTGSAVGPWELL